MARSVLMLLLLVLCVSTASATLTSAAGIVATCLPPHEASLAAAALPFLQSSFGQALIGVGTAAVVSALCASGVAAAPSATDGVEDAHFNFDFADDNLPFHELDDLLKLGEDGGKHSAIELWTRLPDEGGIEPVADVGYTLPKGLWQGEPAPSSSTKPLDDTDADSNSDSDDSQPKKQQQQQPSRDEAEHAALVTSVPPASSTGTAALPAVTTTRKRDVKAANKAQRKRRRRPDTSLLSADERAKRRKAANQASALRSYAYKKRTLDELRAVNRALNIRLLTLLEESSIGQDPATLVMNGVGAIPELRVWSDALLPKDLCKQRPCRRKDATPIPKKERNRRSAERSRKRDEFEGEWLRRSNELLRQDLEALKGGNTGAVADLTLFSASDDANALAAEDDASLFKDGGALSLPKDVHVDTNKDYHAKADDGLFPLLEWGIEDNDEEFDALLDDTIDLLEHDHKPLKPLTEFEPELASL